MVLQNNKLKKSFEFLVSKTCVAYGSFQCVRIKARMPRNDYFSCSICHTEMLAAVSRNPKTGLFKNFDRSLRRNVSKKHTGGLLLKRDLNFMNFRVFQFLPFHFKICCDRITDVFKSLVFCSALTVTPGKSRYVNVEAIFTFSNYGEIFHMALL